MMVAVRMLLGVLLLLLGRRLYWIMVGVGGLLVGVGLAEQLLAHWAPLVRFLVAVGAGVVGVLLAILAQRVAFALLGFYGGAYIGLAVAHSAGGGDAGWLWFVLGGVIGAISATLIMDWAIIVLTALAGAAAIATSFSIGPILQAVVFVVLAGIGIAVQSRGLERRTRPTDTRSGSTAPPEGGR
jgi:hypothetical protein